jgi:cation diffusion facilitator family transporter
MAGSSRKAIIAALIGNGLIALTKFGAAALTGSAAMLSEGVHSVVDTGNQVLLLLGLRRAQRPPSPAFPFGHGKEVYFWSFAVAILIFALGAGISLYQGYVHLRNPEPLENVVVNYIVLGLAILFEAGAFTVALREFNAQRGELGILEAVRRGKDPSLFVVLFEDGAAMLGLLVAMTGIYLADQTGNPAFDGAASMIIGLILALTAVWLAFETQSLLIGESAARWIAASVEAVIGAADGVVGINEVATLQMGPEFILVTASVDFDSAMSADGVEEQVARITRQVKAIDPAVRRVFIEAEKPADHRREMAESLFGRDADA